MDPFIKLECEGKDYRTKVIEEGGKNPKWNEMLTVSLQNTNGNIRFVCYDEDLAINDLVGEAIVKISSISQGSVKRHSFPLLFKGK
jgi:Ca2+-dependent lipid-binding protein